MAMANQPADRAFAPWQAIQVNLSLRFLLGLVNTGNPVIDAKQPRVLAEKASVVESSPILPSTKAYLHIHD